MPEKYDRERQALYLVSLMPDNLNEARRLLVVCGKLLETLASARNARSANRRRGQRRVARRR
ncbi:hypothetical protein V1288_003727 [Bradyrhizobium sp. AZCC 2176]